MILKPELVLLASALSATTLAADTRSSEGARPRGVGPEFAKFYKSSSTFACISNPSITIPASRVNDDFCDCPDGSDEPGTAACSYLSSLSPPQYAPGASIASSSLNLSLPGFYCKNKGHIPSYLRFEFVNDGRCDYDVCCDGSDEYSGVGGKKCPDRCGEIGKEYRKAEEIKNKALQNAMKKRKEYVNKAASLRAEVETKIKGLQAKVEAGEKKMVEATESLKDVERRERTRIVKTGAAGQGTGKTGVLLGLAKARVDELRGALEKTKRYRDSMLDRVGELEAVLTALKEERNPNFNDEGVKRAVQAWEDYAARETDDHWSEAEDRDLDVIMKEDGEENGVNWAEFEGVEVADDDVAPLYQFMNYLPAGMQSWLNDKIDSVRQILIENGVLSTPGSDVNVAESKSVQDAKKAVADAERDLNNAKQDLTNAENDLTKDYGPDSVFLALKDKCVSKDSGEYTYEVCFMGSTKQVSKKNGANTGMGNFNGFEVEVVDEPIPADGKGLGKGERIVMKYENGQSCWNGPNRSTRVLLGCSENEEIWKVTETEKCVYRMEVGTPAACGFGNGSKQVVGGENKKDEL